MTKCFCSLHLQGRLSRPMSLSYSRPGIWLPTPRRASWQQRTYGEARKRNRFFKPVVKPVLSERAQEGGKMNGINWLAFLNTVRTERFNDIVSLQPRIPGIPAA